MGSAVPESATPADGPLAIDAVAGQQIASAASIARLRRAIRDLARRFPAEYARKSPGYLSRLAAVENSVQADAAAATDGMFQSLKREALVLNNPALSSHKILFVRRNANDGLPPNWCNVSSIGDNVCQDHLVILDTSQDVATNIHVPAKNAFIGHPSLHWDANRLLFTTQYDAGGARPLGIFEINIDGSGLQQVSPVDTPPAGPDVDWFDGCYLPNGDVLMCGTAGFAGVPCVGGLDHVGNIYRLTRSTGVIRQLTADQDQNWGPTMLADGRVMFTRWEYSDLPHYFSRILMTMMPDGLEQFARSGSNSYWPNALFDVKPVPNHPSRFVGIVSGHHGVRWEGELILFDEAKGNQEADGVVHRYCGPNPVVPEVRDFYIDERNPWPRFIQPAPLDESQVLVAARTTPTGTFGIYIVDQFDNCTLVRQEAGKNLVHPIPVGTQPPPPVIPDRVKPGMTTGVVNIADVHFGPGLKDVPRGKVRNLRVYSLHYGYRDQGGHANVAIDGTWDVRRIIGTVPVYEDGSASFTAPANVPISIEPLDEEGKALQVFRSWYTVMPGETVSCSGCHEDRRQGMANRVSIASRKPPDAITPWRGPERGFSFTREVQPVLDKACSGCHGGTGGPVNVPPQLHNINRVDGDGDSPIDATANTFPNSYVSLHKFVRRPGNEGYLRLNNPGEYHADNSELVQLLRKGHHGVTLDAEAWDRLYTWIDLNVPAFGTWGEHMAVGGSPNYATRRRETMAAYANVTTDPEVYPTAAPPRGTFVNPTPPTVPAAQTPPSDSIFGVTEAKQRRNAIVTPTRPAEWVVNLAAGVDLVLDLIPSGRFLMGSVSGYQDEYPQTVANIAHPYYMGKYEVTNRQFALFNAGHHSGFIQAFGKDHNSQGWYCEGPNQPVMRVSWQDAMGFCEWLTKRTGRRFTLPTEAQWEYACRAGTATDMWYGPATSNWNVDAKLIWGDDFYRYGRRDNFAGYEYFNNSTPNMMVGSPRWYPADLSVTDWWVAPGDVTSFASNPFGLCAMHGNVAEWTLSSYAAYPYADDGRNRAVYSDAEWLSLKKVVRGGSCMDRTKRGTASFRTAIAPWLRGYNVGFRVVADSDATLPPLPMADFTATPDSGVVDLHVTFDGTASGDADGNIVKYRWDFGDNTTSDAAGPLDRVYRVPGTYQVTLTVTDNDGFTASTSRTVTASGQIGGGAAPVAEIAVSPGGGSAPCTMVFNGTDSHDPDGVVTAWYWDFGDGTAGSGRLASHTYSVAGHYTASLSVIDDKGLRDTGRVSIVIGGSNGNLPPMVEAGDSAFGTLADGIALCGSVADDGLPAPPVLATQWSKVRGPGSVAFANPADPVTAASFGTIGEYVLQLAASDGQLDTTDLVTVTITEQGPYRSPVEVAYSPAGSLLAVADETARSLVLMDPAAQSVVQTIRLAGEPRDLVWTSGERLFVSEHDAGTIAEIDVPSGAIVRRIQVGPKPAGLAFAPGRNLLLVTDRGLDKLSLVDRQTGGTCAEVPLVREPVAVTVTPDEKLAIAVNRLPYGDARDPAHAAAVSVVNLDDMQEVDHIKLMPGATNLQSAICSPDGRWAYVLHVQGRPFLPTTQLSRGWVITSAMSIIDLVSKQLYSTVLFDMTSDGAADPWGLTLSNDGSTAWVTFAGVHEIGILDLHNLHALLAGDDGLRKNMHYDLTTLYNRGLLQRKALPCNGPRGIEIAPDQQQVAVAAWFSGEVLLLDPAGAVVARLAPGARPPEDSARRGARLYHDATGCFQRWLSCNSCHPGARVDGMNWDLLNDGFGNPKNVKSALYAPQTPPSMWTGIRADAMVGIQAGFKFIEFQAHPQQDYDDIHSFMESLRPEKSPHLAGGGLTPDAVQGKAIFESTETNCLGCHKPDHYYGDTGKYDVGTRHEADWTGNDISGYVSPPLHELWRSAPYLHDGSAATIREVLTTHNPADRHGRTSHLTSNQIDQLAAYLLQLDGDVPADPGPLWNLTVNGGDGSGAYLEGAKVTLAAAPAPAGKTFYRWVGDGVANPDSPTATLTMPAADLSVTAIYLDDGGWIGLDPDDSLWSSPDNWAGRKVPVPGVDGLVFAGRRRLNATNDLPVDSSFKGIHFLSTADPFILGGNGITLDGNVASDSPGCQMIDLPMVLTGTTTFDAVAGRIVAAGPLSGPGGLVKTGGGELALGSTNGYAGPTTVLAGVLRIDADNSGAAGDLTVAAGAVLAGGGTAGGEVTVAGLLSPASTGPAATFRMRSGGNLLGGATTALRVLSADGSCDRIVVEGGILTFGGTLAVGFSEPVSNGTNCQLFIRSGDSFAGDFPAVRTTGLAPCQHATFDPATGVLTARSPYHDWLATCGVAGSDADPLADPDHDGAGNLAEFGLLGDPKVVDPAATQPLVGRSGDGCLTIEFSRRTDDPSLTVLAERTSDLDLGAWTTAGIELVGSPVDILENGAKIGERVTCRILPAMSDSSVRANFVRIRISW